MTVLLRVAEETEDKRIFLKEHKYIVTASLDVTSSTAGPNYWYHSTIDNRA